MITEAKPRSAQTEKRTIVTSVARAPLTEMYPPEGKLPSLIRDARENPLVKQSLHEGDVLVKSPAFPYVDHHMLVIPDRADHGHTPSLTHVPERLLAKTFATVGEVAAHYSENPDIKEVNIGWNHSPQEDKKHVATQVNTLHVHVVGMTDADLAHTVSLDEIKTRPELKTKEREPLTGLITSLLEKEVFAELEQEPSFSDQFQKGYDGRVTYKLKNGINALKNPAFANTMQTIHERTAKAYQTLADCFFEKSSKMEPRYAETPEGRFYLLDKETRVENIVTYLDDRPYLNEVEKRQLTFLASQAMPMSEIHEVLAERKERELTEDEKYGRSPEMAIKGLAYAAVITGVKQDNGEFSWRFGIDPVVFAPRDVVQASRGTFAHFERKDEVMPAARLAAMQKDERKLADRILTKAANRGFLV